MNTCYNCLDRHVERGFGSQPAIIHDSPVTNTIRKISYKELLSEVNTFVEVHARISVIFFICALYPYFFPISCARVYLEYAINII